MSAGRRLPAPQHDAAKVTRVPILGTASSGRDNNAPMMLLC